MRKKMIKLGLIALVCLSLVGLTACGNQASESQQQIVEVSLGDIVVSVSADGNLSLLQHRKLTFGTSGKIAEVNVEEGDRVTEGQVLGNLDTTPVEHMVKTAELAVKTAELVVETGELAVKAAEIDLELATNSYQQLTTPYPYLTFQFVIPESVDAIRVAQQQIKEAQEEFQKGLEGKQYSMGEVKEQLREAQESLAEAETKLAWGLGEGIRPSSIDYWTLRATQIQVEKAQLALDITQRDLDKARSNLDIAQNDLDKVNDELEKAVILAPFDGIIAKVNIKPGDVLSPMNYATTIAIEVIDPSRMELNAEVDEIDMPGVKLGQRAIISVDALPDVTLEGEIISISLLSREEAGLVLYEVKTGFAVPEGAGLKVGMSATADIVIDERSGVLLVPSRAIKQDSQGNPVVMVVVNEQTEERLVVIGISDGFDTEIVSGLSEGEVVVIERRAR